MELAHYRKVLWLNNAALRNPSEEILGAQLANASIRMETLP
jgi:hypothetical protein